MSTDERHSHLSRPLIALKTFVASAGPTRAEQAIQLAQSHAVESLGYLQACSQHTTTFNEGVLVLLKGRTDKGAHDFALFVESNGTIQDDDVPVYKYWSASRTGRLTWRR
jgi:hypothetical protein